MKNAMAILSISAIFAAGALADDWSGKLLDATCLSTDQTSPAGACYATPATNTFALNVDGKIYKLDSTGNAKASDALKNQAARSKDPAKATSAPINAKVSGTLMGDVITASSVQLQ